MALGALGDRSAVPALCDTLKDDAAQLAKFLLECCKEGVNILPDGRFYVSTVHSEKDVEETLAAIDRACARLA